MDRPPLKKWGNVAVLSMLAFMVPLASSMFAPGIPQVLIDFDTTNPSLATFVVSVYVLGLAAYVVSPWRAPLPSCTVRTDECS